MAYRVLIEIPVGDIRDLWNTLSVNPAEGLVRLGVPDDGALAAEWTNRGRTITVGSGQFHGFEV